MLSEFSSVVLIPAPARLTHVMVTGCAESGVQRHDLVLDHRVALGAELVHVRREIGAGIGPSPIPAVVDDDARVDDFVDVPDVVRVVVAGEMVIHMGDAQRLELLDHGQAADTGTSGPVVEHRDLPQGADEDRAIPLADIEMDDLEPSGRGHGGSLDGREDKQERKQDGSNRILHNAGSPADDWRLPVIFIFAKRPIYSMWDIGARSKAFPARRKGYFPLAPLEFSFRMTFSAPVRPGSSPPDLARVPYD